MSNIAQNRRNRRLKRFGLLLIFLYVMMGSILYYFQEKMLFLPTVLPENHVFEFKHDFEEFFLETDDNAIINSLLFKAEQPRGAILYFHGNAGDLQRWGRIVEYLVDLNYDVYIMDYRTYGKSKGELSEAAMYNDAKLCYNHLRTFWNEDQITIFGRSLGGAMASYLASEVKVKQLILETPFYSLVDVAKHRFPMFPVKSLLTYKFPNHEYLKDLTIPITIFHGTNDFVVPYSSGEKLYMSAPQENTQFFTIEEGGHNDLINFESYKKEITTLLKH